MNRLTQGRLRQIIKEELSRVVNEMDMMGEKAMPTPAEAFNLVMYYYERDPGSDVGGMPVNQVAEGLGITDAEAFRLLYQAGGMTRDGMTIRPNRMGNLFFVVPAR